MPFSHVWSRRGVHTKFTGILSKEELMLHKAEIFMLGTAEMIDYIIIDLLAVTGADMAAEDVRDFARMSSDMFKPYEGVREIKVPIVAAAADLIDLSQKYVESHTGKVLVPRVFCDLIEATAWIELQSVPEQAEHSPPAARLSGSHEP